MYNLTTVVEYKLCLLDVRYYYSEHVNDPYNACILYGMLSIYGYIVHSERGNLGVKCVHMNMRRQKQGRACALNKDERGLIKASAFRC